MGKAQLSRFIRLRLACIRNQVEIRCRILSKEVAG